MTSLYAIPLNRTGPVNHIFVTRVTTLETYQSPEKTAVYHDWGEAALSPLINIQKILSMIQTIFEIHFRKKERDFLKYSGFQLKIYLKIYNMVSRNWT